MFFLMSLGIYSLFFSTARDLPIAVGDLNIKINAPDDRNTSLFLNLLYELDFHPLFPNSPTHELGNILDFAFVSSSLLPYFLSIQTDNSITLSDGK